VCLALPYLLQHLPRDVVEDLISHTAPSAASATWNARLPNATPRVLPGGDHHWLLREPAWCLAATGAFMSAQTLDGRSAA